MYGARDTPRQRLAEDVEDLVRELSAVNERLGHAFASRHGLHPSDLTALLAVMHAEGRGEPITAGDLVGHLGLTSGAVTGVIDRLEGAGHLRRERDALDRRKVRLHYGERGQRLAVSFFGPLGALYEAVTSTMTDDELRIVHSFLSRIATATAAALAEVEGGGAAED